jgi:hypothetical protein
MELLDALDKIADIKAEGTSDAGNRRQTRIATSPFKQRDLGAMQATSKAELLLGKTLVLSGRSEVGSKLFAGLHARIVSP